jgi:hypothetical protein
MEGGVKQTTPETVTWQIQGALAVAQNENPAADAF